MNKIDVVIPTIMNSNITVFGYLLTQLYESPVVNLVIVVDNTDDQSFKKRIGILSHPEYTDKLRVINGHKYDCYVNAAWNHGMNMVSYKPDVPYYALINDDIILKSDVMHDVTKVLDIDPSISLVTLKTVNDIPISAYLKNWTDHSEGITESIPNGRQGWFIAGRKKQWKHIPGNLKLFYGDDYIYMMARRCGRAVMLNDPIISHFQSSSVNKNMSKLKPIIDQDGIEWNKMLKQLKNES